MADGWEPRPPYLRAVPHDFNQDGWFVAGEGEFRVGQDVIMFEPWDEGSEFAVVVTVTSVKPATTPGRAVYDTDLQSRDSR